jgi:hypothetical protein
MKTLKLSLVALVLALGLGGAVAEKIQAAPKALDQVYSWTASGKPNFSGTIAQAEANYGCNNAAVPVCATGTAPGVQPATIHKSM